MKCPEISLWNVFGWLGGRQADFNRNTAQKVETQTKKLKTKLILQEQVICNFGLSLANKRI
jgi:hypothetical protein